MQRHNALHSDNHTDLLFERLDTIAKEASVVLKAKKIHISLFPQEIRDFIQIF